MENCPCPAPAAIPTIPATTCKENLGQIVRLILTRHGNQIAVNEASALLLATYTALVAAVDGTKIQFTPGLLEAVTIPAGTAITEGGDDNSTPLGRQLVVGASSIIQETGLLRNVDSTVIKTMKEFECEGLDIALVNQFGQIAFHKNADNSLRGFRSHAFFVGDKGNDGLNTQDKAMIRWGFDAGWRDNLVLVTPTAWDPRYDI